ncbi:rCG34943 [Rattus norvegicus]|uniref:RCG34943 n=1 Tax=Rattus norvegicus TaxID=10116 RepID=A6HI20_RAT|nr:rCG34943 [Rattus norvegicus]
MVVLLSDGLQVPGKGHRFTYCLIGAEGVKNKLCEFFSGLLIL